MKHALALMQKSDEVVLVGNSLRDVSVISPSGEDVISYFDAKVLRTWKGSHKAGDIITFVLPFGGIGCTKSVVTNDLVFTETARKDMTEFNPFSHDGPYVLFLRQSRGDETALMPGLRLAGGDGTQGIFAVHSDLHDCICASLDHSSPACWAAWGAYYSAGNDHDRIVRCNSGLNVDNGPLKSVYRRDQLGKKYEGMPVSQFLQEVQSVAGSLSDAQAISKIN